MKVEDLIAKLQELLKEDPLKAWVYLQGMRLTKRDGEILQNAWMDQKDWRKEIDKLMRGAELFNRSIEKELCKVRSRELKKRYKKLFGREVNGKTC